MRNVQANIISPHFLLVSSHHLVAKLCKQCVVCKSTSCVSDCGLWKHRDNVIHQRRYSARTSRKHGYGISEFTQQGHQPICFDFGEFYADFLRLFGAFSSSSGMHLATKFWGMCIIGSGTPLRSLPLLTGDSPDTVPHQPQPDLGGREAEGAVSREAATIICHDMS